MNRVIVLFLSLIIIGCNDGKKGGGAGSCKSQIELIKKMEQDFVASEFDKSLVKGLMVSYAEFSNSCPADSLAPEFLMRRADLLRGEGKVREAIRQFKAIHDGYPQYANHITCAFVAAFLYETELNDVDMAEKLYLQIIESYPKSPEAEVARVSLRHLRETPSEMMMRLKGEG
jgi:tetratricopeptide (TPR) repeat protein